MAKTSKGKNEFLYIKEREDFLKDLRQFHQNRGHPFTQIPKIGGKEVDLFLLFRKIQEIGGFTKATEEFLWDDVQTALGLPVACANASQGLKNIYLRYLDLYQRVLAGDDPDQRSHEEFEEMTSNSKRHKSSLITVPMLYKHHQHNVPDMLRLNAGMSLSFVTRHGQQKLERALLSGLPNEVDFAINVATLLSNEGKHKLHLDYCPRIVDLFLAHVGLFRDGESSLYEVYSESWKPLSERNFTRFWLDAVSDKEIQALLLPSALLEKGVKGMTTSGKEADHPDKICLNELLNLDVDLGVHSVEGQRALQIATIIRNLSFETENKSKLANDKLVLRFLLLCTYSKFSTLKQLALDTLGNLSGQLELDPIEFAATQLVFKTVSKCIGSQDRFEVVRGLEIISRLSQVLNNQDILALNLQEKVYEDIANYLTVHDIQLIVFTLEAMYQLSKLGEITSSSFATCKSVIDILVDLITVEAQSYGPNSLQGIKVVEHVPAGILVPPGVQPVVVTPGRPMPPPPVPQTTPRLTMVQIQPSPHTLQPQRPVMVINNALQSPPPQAQPGTTIAVSPVQVSQQAHTPEFDAEVTARSWLTAHLEPGTGDVKKTEIFSEYINACNRHHLRTVQAAAFPKCVRFTFPKVDSFTVEKDGMIEVYYRGLCKRSHPLPFPPTKGGVGLPQVPSSARAVVRPMTVGQPLMDTGSPILQNQLNSPAVSRSAAAPTSPTQNQHPILQQALSGTAADSQPTDTQTIKSLLAKKLQQNIRTSANATNVSMSATPTLISSTVSQPTASISAVPLMLPIVANTQPQTQIAATNTVMSTDSPILAGQLNQPIKPLVGQPPVACLAAHNAIMERLVNKIGGTTTVNPNDKSNSGSASMPEVAQAEATLKTEELPATEKQAENEIVSCQESSTPQTEAPMANGPVLLGPNNTGDNVPPESVSKLNGPAALDTNGALNNQNSVKQGEESADESQSQLVKSCHTADLQHVNGNSEDHRDKQQMLPHSFKRKDLLNQDEIQAKKNNISHWLTAKDNAPILNGVVKHIGNGDTHKKLNFVTGQDSKSTSVVHEIENGYASSCESEKMQVDEMESENPSLEISSSVIPRVVTSQGSNGEGKKSEPAGPEQQSGQASQQSGPALPLMLQSEAQPAVVYVPPPAPATKGIGHLPVADLLMKNQPVTTSNGSSAADPDSQPPSIPTADQLQASLRAAQCQSPVKSAIVSQLQARLHPPARLSASQQANVPPISQNPIMVAALKGPLKVENSSPIKVNTDTPSSTVADTPHSQQTDTQGMVSPGQKRPASANDEETAAKRKRSTSTDSSSSSNSQTGDLLCEWAACNKGFETMKSITHHVIQEHMAKLTGEGLCQWTGCDSLMRKKYSLMTHVQDKHMTEASLKAAAQKRQQSGGVSKTPSQASSTPANTPAPVYPDHAAFQAISRFAIRPPYQELMEMKEGPVTKHIRLTSALILRNLARHSAIARSSIRRHERHIAYVALSAVESSTALAGCLWELSTKH